MYLKSLEIRGFKSFADKTELTFKSGITGVVGPNGSGKSNIADAVRWVLGEQSVKQLRGGRMEDVIFSGTQYRKSLGQAQVSMTLDNSCGTLPIPYNEVTVTRKLFRSGDSEYLINNSQVRLKDVNELFMDTGIGKEGYSIIGQGKIDTILSGKPEERRSLVEEAAGITKFKSRKEEGEKKLKNAEDNLDRVEDIISTYEERIEPLRIDKEKAEKFLEYSGELVGLQISVIVSDLNEMDRKNEGLLNQREAQNKRFVDAKTDKEIDEAELSKLEEKLNEISSDRSQTREDYYLRKGSLDEVINDIRFGESRISNDSEKLKANSISYIAATEKLENNKNQIITATEGLKTYETKLTKSLDDVSSLRNSALKLEEDIKISQEATSNLKDSE
ncbi:MAG: AAA family ATPase, partial [Clostridiaceae bacterium]